MRKLFILVAIAAAVRFSDPMVGTAQSEPEKFIGEGVFVATQKYDRYRQKPYQSHGMATPVEEWIVRIDRWENGTKSLGYFLVTYEAAYERVFSEEEMNQAGWRFAFENRSSTKQNLVRATLRSGLRTASL